MSNAKKPLTSRALETILIDGRAYATHNSENQLIHATEAGLRDFWQWFDGSMATDDFHRPKVFYHGTDTVFTEFKKGVHVNFNNPQRLVGFFFVEEKAYAKQYGDIVMPVYLAIQKPDLATVRQIDKLEISSDSNAKSWKKRRKDKGYDGVVFGQGNSTEWVVFGQGNSTEWVAFESSQIRLAQLSPVNADDARAGTLIGSGNSGDVYRLGDEVEKNSTNDEAKVYALLAGFIGTAKGYEVGGMIRLPFYAQVISVDTVARDDRSAQAEIIRPNVERINNAVSALARTGYDYNDPLQFGVNAAGEMDLLDFSIASNNFPKDVLRDNFASLARFYREFGLKAIGDAVSQVSEVLRGQHARIDGPFLYEFFGDEDDGINYRELEAALQGKKACYGYYALHGGPVNLPEAVQTAIVDGVSVVLSLRQLSASEVIEHRLVNVYAAEDNTLSLTHSGDALDADEDSPRF